MFGFFITTQAFALNFTVSRINVTGLQRIPKQTVLSYMPIRPGQEITTAKSNNVIKKLYATGFFKNVSLSQSGTTLNVHVVERPLISKIVLSGNKVVPTKALLKVLKGMNIAQGYEYNQAVITNIKTALLDQYYSHGKYNAKIHITHALNRKNNTVAVYINISEGLTAAIKQIKVIGNHKFTEKEVLGQFTLSTPGLLTFYTHDDQYSSDRLSSDLDHLHAFYLNHGYLKMKIDSEQVSLTPDKKHVYILVKITEGSQYKFSGYRITGQAIVPKAKLNKLVTIKKGEIFSKQQIVAGEKAIGDELGSKGYAWANISAHNTLNEKNKTIFVTYKISQGRRVYVRRILFKGNAHTNDSAFRRELTQMEASMVSTRQISYSKQSLLQLPFVKNVQVQKKPVPGRNNEEDLIYNITTAPAGEIMAGVGYSDVDGLMVNASLSQQNFFGTGNAFSMNASYSASMLQAGVSYFNPYYTPWGVGRGYSLYAQRYDASKANSADFTTNDYGGTINYVIPLARFNAINFSFGIDYLTLQLNNNPAKIMTAFKQRHGKRFLQVPINLSWTYNSFNRAIFPTQGLMQNLGISFSAPVRSASLEYYKASYGFVYYHPIYHSFVGRLGSNVAYGNGYGAYKYLPFFKNYLMGGMGSVRGYEANTLGPRDSNGDTIGGNLMFNATASIIFPNPIGQSVRTSLFVDAGNVYNTYSMGRFNTPPPSANNTNPVPVIQPDAAGLRYSAGLEIDWLSPLGLLNFSLAKAINPHKGDSTSIFQFNIGTSF